MRVPSRKSLTLVLALILTLASVSPSWAAKPYTDAGRTLIDTRLTETRLADGKRVEAATGRVLAIYRADWQADTEAGNAEAAARAYLTAHAAELGLDHENLSDLAVRAVRTGIASDVVRFEQRYNDILVRNAEVTVTVRHDGVVRYIASTYQPGIALVSSVATVSEAEGRERAAQHLNLAGTRHYERADLVVHARPDDDRLAWRIRTASADTVGDWEVLVDAQSGELLRSENLELYIDGTGNVFDPDPLTSATATYGDTGFVDGGDADTPQLTGEVVNMVLPDITFDAGLFHLTGPWAEYVDWDSPFVGDFAQATSDWTFTRFADAFEGALTYFHIDQHMRYLNSTLGLTLVPYQYATGVQFDAHGFNGADNSSYSTGSGRLRFGEGGVDDAEDADVVLHELGHGLHDWVTVGGLSQVQGLSEGSGDYVAQSYSRSLGYWAPADPAYHYVFSWDGHNPFWPGRLTNWLDTHVYPDDLTGSIHSDGQFWSSCMMRVWDAIGRDQTDRAFWSGLASTNGGTNQEDAAQAVLQAAEDLGYPGSDIGAMFNEMIGCGYNVTSTGLIFSDGFESGDTDSWDSQVP